MTHRLILLTAHPYLIMDKNICNFTQISHVSRFMFVCLSCFWSENCKEYFPRLHRNVIFYGMFHTDGLQLTDSLHQYNLAVVPQYIFINPYIALL